MSLVNAVPNSNLYILAPSLQQGFIDKDTGLPLAYGVVTFYRDEDRTALKDVFKITGTPDDPVFVALQNPMTLSSIGTMFDDNNDQDIIPYYYPYDADGNVDLYYITVTSAPKPGFPDGVPQFVREHYPSVNSSGSDLINQVQSWVPNGQFLEHQDIPNNGAITQNVTAIAFGGWSFYTDNYTSSHNFVTFERYDSPIDSPEANPRYACRVACTLANPSDGRKDLELIITDVNFLQGQAATSQFTANSNDGNNHNVQLILRKYFGAGGSPTAEHILATLTITPEIQNFLINYTVPSNNGLILGAGDDDALLLIIRGPLASTSDISYTNDIGVQGTYALLNFSPVTPEQTKAFAFPASFKSPAFDGSDSGKFLVVEYDNDDPSDPKLAFVYKKPVPTGTFILSGISSTTPPDGGYLYCGGEGYAIFPGGTVTQYSDLFNKIGYEFGTGINGFSNVGLSANQFDIYWNRYDVSQPTPSGGASGFVFTVAQAIIPGTQPLICTITCPAGSAIAPGAYYLQQVNTTGPQFTHLFWFTVDGVGTIPNVAFDVQIPIALLSTDTSSQVAAKIYNWQSGIFAVPDPRGYIPRIWDNGAQRDPGANSRSPSAGPTLSFPYLILNGASGDLVGSAQASSNLSHNHPAPSSAPAPGANVYIRNVGSSSGTLRVNESSNASVYELDQAIWYDPCDSSGNPSSTESRPLNMYFNAFIKY